MLEAENGNCAYLWMRNKEGLVLFELLVERLDELKSGDEKFLEQLPSVRSFFDVEFFARLNQYGQRHETSFRLAATVDRREGVCALPHQNRRARLKPDLAILMVTSCRP